MARGRVTQAAERAGSRIAEAARFSLGPRGAFAGLGSETANRRRQQSLFGCFLPRRHGHQLVVSGVIVLLLGPSCSGGPSWQTRPPHVSRWLGSAEL
jgi:hypothetical protein